MPVSLDRTTTAALALGFKDALAPPRGPIGEWGWTEDATRRTVLVNTRRLLTIIRQAGLPIIDGGLSHTELSGVLAPLNVSTVILCGPATQRVIEEAVHLVAEACDQVIVARDCCSLFSAGNSQASAQSFASLVTVSNSPEIVAALFPTKYRVSPRLAGLEPICTA